MPQNENLTEKSKINYLRRNNRKKSKKNFIFINPGSSSFSKNKKISFGYSSLLQGFEEELTKNNFLFSYPLKKFHFSFAFDILNLKDVYRESIYLLNFSKNGYGLNLKILSNKYLWNDEYLKGDEVLSKREKKELQLILA